MGKNVTCWKAFDAQFFARVRFLSCIFSHMFLTIISHLLNSRIICDDKHAAKKHNTHSFALHHFISAKLCVCN